MPPKPKNDAPAVDTPAVDVLEPQPEPRAFKLRAAPVDGTPEDELVTRLAFGDSPAVSIGTGETFTTTDAKIAARCAAQPLLEEISA